MASFRYVVFINSGLEEDDYPASVKGFSNLFLIPPLITIKLMKINFNYFIDLL